MSSNPRGAWRAPSALATQGPLPEGGSETYVYTFLFLRPGQPEGSGERINTMELTPDQYRAAGGRRGVAVLVEQQRKAWAALARRRHMEGSVVVIKMRGYRRSQWAVPAGVE